MLGGVVMGMWWWISCTVHGIGAWVVVVVHGWCMGFLRWTWWIIKRWLPGEMEFFWLITCMVRLAHHHIPIPTPPDIAPLALHHTAADTYDHLWKYQTALRIHESSLKHFSDDEEISFTNYNFFCLHLSSFLFFVFLLSIVLQIRSSTSVWYSPFNHSCLKCSACFDPLQRVIACLNISFQ